ncbi:MAG: hypothetical protein Q9222_002225 [Ikaeria aurantiellina]
MAPTSSSERATNSRKKSDRPKTRNLVRWNEDMDKKLLLTLQWACNKRGVKIPWDMVAEEMGTTISAGAVIQHLAKFRSRMVDQGLEVPPPLTRGGNNASEKTGKTQNRVQKSRTTRHVTNRSKAQTEHSGSEDEGDDEDIDKASGSDDYTAKLPKTKGKAKGAKKTRGKKAKAKEDESESSHSIKKEASLSEKDDLENVRSENSDNEENEMQHYAVGDSMWELSGLKCRTSESRPVQVQSSSPSSPSLSSPGSQSSSKVVVLQIGQDGFNRLGQLDGMEPSEAADTENPFGSERSRDSSDQYYIGSRASESDNEDTGGPGLRIAEGDQDMYGYEDGNSIAGPLDNVSHSYVGSNGPAMANLAHRMGYSGNTSLDQESLSFPATLGPCYPGMARQSSDQSWGDQESNFQTTPEYQYDDGRGIDMGFNSAGWSGHELGNHRPLGGPVGGRVLNVDHQNGHYDDPVSSFSSTNNLRTDGSFGMHRLAMNAQFDDYGLQGRFPGPNTFLAEDLHSAHQYPSHWPKESFSSTESWDPAVNGFSNFGNVGIRGYAESPQAMTRAQSGIEQYGVDDEATKVESDASWDAYLAMDKVDRGF